MTCKYSDFFVNLHVGKSKRIRSIVIAFPSVLQARSCSAYAFCHPVLLARCFSARCGVLRFDNEAGKGDHKHVANTEEPYKFNGPEALLEDFWSEVDKWRR